MRRVLVAGNGDLPPWGVLAPWLRRADTVVAADGGANRLLALGIEPHHVVGDLDSILGSTRRRIPAPRIHRRSDPNHTDLEKALDFAERRGARDFTVMGVSEGRLDHVSAALAILVERSARLAIRFVDSEFTTQVVRGRLRFRAPVGTLLSLYAPSQARGVRSKGLRWPLEGKTLRPGSRGIHNEVCSNPVEISVGGGELLVMRGHRVSPHR